MHALVLGSRPLMRGAPGTLSPALPLPQSTSGSVLSKLALSCGSGRRALVRACVYIEYKCRSVLRVAGVCVAFQGVRSAAAGGCQQVSLPLAGQPVFGRRMARFCSLDLSVALPVCCWLGHCQCSGSTCSSRGQKA